MMWMLLFVRSNDSLDDEIFPEVWPHRRLGLVDVSL